MGNRVALYSRSFFQRLLYIMGDFVQRWPKLIIFISFIVLSLCFIGLKDVTIETDLVKLWVQRKVLIPTIKYKISILTF